MDLKYPHVSVYSPSMVIFYYRIDDNGIKYPYTIYETQFDEGKHFSNKYQLKLYLSTLGYKLKYVKKSYPFSNDDISSIAHFNIEEI